MLQLIQMLPLISLMLVAGQSPKIDLIVYNCNSDRPIPRSESSFWSHRQYLDTISISGGNIPEFIVQRVKRLVKEEYTYELSIEAAMIISTSNSCDTLYTNQFFHLWQTKEGNFVDSSGHLARMFSGLNLIQYFGSDK